MALRVVARQEINARRETFSCRPSLSRVRPGEPRPNRRIYSIGRTSRRFSWPIKRAPEAFTAGLLGQVAEHNKLPEYFDRSLAWPQSVFFEIFLGE